jgi:hypothetical protein
MHCSEDAASFAKQQNKMPPAVRPLPNHTTTIDEFNVHKKTICKVLRARNDMLPFVVATGTLGDELAIRESALRVRALGDDARLVRGYRLVTVPGLRPEPTFNAIPAVCIVHADGTRESLHHSTSDDASKLVFVPSRRMHPDVTDDDLANATQVLCTVVVCPIPVRHSLSLVREKLSWFEQRRFTFSPEEGKPRRLIISRAMPVFALWMQSDSLRIQTIDDALIAFGFPFRELAGDEHTEAVVSNAPHVNDVYDAHELLAPVPPWAFERRCWLPSVPALHAFHARILETEGEDAAWLAHAEEYANYYRQLESEYMHRLYKNADTTGVSLPDRLEGATSLTFE